MRAPTIDPSRNILTARLAKATLLKLMHYPTPTDELCLVAFFFDPVLGFASGVVSMLERTEEWR